VEHYRSPAVKRRRTARPKPAVVALALGLVATLGGCGGTGTHVDSTDSSSHFSGRARAVAAVVEDYSRSLGRHDFKRICDVLYTPLNKQAHTGLVDGGCAAMLAADFGTAGNVDFEVTKVRPYPSPSGFPGERGSAMEAFINVTGTFPHVSPNPGPFTLVLEGGRWRIASGG
jgi:hypothetical protein